MKLKDLLKQSGRKLAGRTPPADLTDGDVRDLIRFLETCELDCEQVFDVLDQYAEIEVRHEDAARLMPLVREHLKICHDCCDEYEALLDVLANASKA
ncbi:MAG: hypothetical protein AB1750_15505 [Chloroflexota bacterium]